MKTSRVWQGLMIIGWAFALSGPSWARGRVVSPAAVAARHAGPAAVISAAITGAVPRLSGCLAAPELSRLGAQSPASISGAAFALSQPISLARFMALPQAAVMPAFLAPAAIKEQTQASALATAGKMAEEVSVAKAVSPAAVRRQLDVRFDQAVRSTDESAVIAQAGPAVAADSSLRGFQPRVVFLQDLFQKPASDEIVDDLEKLLDGGVHVVFMTPRPPKGPGSADEILLNRLKARRINPVIVASYNGARITLQGRAAKPKPIADVAAFGREELELLHGFNAQVARSMGLPEGTPLGERIVAEGKSSYAFEVELPPAVADEDVAAMRAKLEHEYNLRLEASGVPYLMQAQPGNPRAVIAYSMPLRFAVPRVMEALEAQFRGENLSQAADKLLVLADSRLSESFPRQADVQSMASADDIEGALDAVLGVRTLPTVSLKLGKLRQYVEYWEPSHRFARNGESSGGGGALRASSDRHVHQGFAMYAGTVLYQLMAWQYEQVWRGQHKFAGLTALQARLRSMWYNPLKYGVHIGKSLAQSMKSKAWKDMQHGYFEYANSYLTNFYMREFGDYTSAARDVQMNLVSLATDRKSLITLDFVAPSTKRVYKVHTRIPRVMKLDTAEGRTLIAYSYRTGKETPDDGEEFLARILAMALLKGHARQGEDGKWHHGSSDGPVVAKLKVQLEYRSSHRSWVFNTDDLLKLQDGGEVSGPVVRQIISAIEREEADEEYQKYYQEQEEKTSQAELAEPAPVVGSDAAAQRAPSAKRVKRSGA
ncbi:MAG TPA: hypothetical protein DEB40_02845 [Elusimicrobia bacterium]|nr:hypothetical protein [Elusimicrobiota bacterium]HBT60668.1 hypothetical protein [Elusimicrobiota bacterium]